MAAVGEGFFYALTSIQVSLILLAAPAAAAGSLGMDRARGTLLQMMATDLSDMEIVLGTLAARLAPVVGLIVCAVPVTALAALLGGIDSAALTGALVVSLSLALLGCVLALTLSVWVTRLHEVLLAVYIAEASGCSQHRSGRGWVELWHGSRPRGSGRRTPTFSRWPPTGSRGMRESPTSHVSAAGVLALSAGLWGSRSRGCGGSSSNSRAGRRRPVRAGDWYSKKVFPTWMGPTLDGNPVLWREWHRNRPSRMAARDRGAALGVAWALAFWGTSVFNLPTACTRVWECLRGASGSLSRSDC